MLHKIRFLKYLGELCGHQCAPATDLSVAQALEIQMQKKVLVIGGIITATLLVGGWALAQSGEHGPGGMRGMGMGMGMGMNMQGQMGSRMRGRMGVPIGYSRAAAGMAQVAAQRAAGANSRDGVKRMANLQR